MSATEVRTTLVLPPELVEKLDDYWHTMRLNSRPDAIRELLRLALETKPVEYALRRARNQASDAQPAKEQRRG